MPEPDKTSKLPRTAGPSLFGLLKPYRGLVLILVVMTILGNSLNLVVPRMIAHAIDTYAQQRLVLTTLIVQFFAVGFGIFVFAYLQAVAQTYASERVAKDLRTQLVAKMSTQDHAFIQQITPAKLLTNLTSDVDAIKMFVSQAIASIISSIFLIIGVDMIFTMLFYFAT